MLGQVPNRRLHLIHTSLQTESRQFAQEIVAGLTAAQKHLPYRFLYDDEGSRLFERICDQPEYYLTQAEAEIFEQHAAAILDRVPDPALLAELGPGNARKTRYLLDEIFRRRWRMRYLPIDISRKALEQTAVALLRDYPRLEITAIAGEYTEGLRELIRHEHPQLILWLGSNIGNLSRTEAAAFLGGVHATLEYPDRLLLGIDVCRDADILLAAYDDHQGVTADFNRNLLARINREFGGHFVLANFLHRADFDEDQDRVELSLVSKVAQRVPIDDLGIVVELAEGEAIVTEHSYKYGPGEIEKLASAANFSVAGQWFDRSRRFSVNLFKPMAK